MTTLELMQKRRLEALEKQRQEQNANQDVPNVANMSESDVSKLSVAYDWENDEVESTSAEQSSAAQPTTGGGEFYNTQGVNHGTESQDLPPAQQNASEQSKSKSKKFSIRGDESEKESPNLLHQASVRYGQEFKSEDQLFSYIDSLKSKSENGVRFANDFVKELNDAVSAGVDVKEYIGLSQVSYDTYSDEDIQIFLMQSQAQNRLGRAMTESELADFMEKIKPALEEIGFDETGAAVNYRDRMEYDNYRAQWTKAKNDKIQQLKDNASREWDRKVQVFENTISKMKDVYGLKLTDDHRAQIVDAFKRGDLLRDLLYDRDGEFSPSPLIHAAFMAAYGKEAISKLMKRAKIDGQRELIDKTSNVDLNPGNAQAPEERKLTRRQELEESFRNQFLNKANR
jgi:hypothetical protein